MIKKILLTTISIFVLSHLSFAQPQGGSIKGKVKDETGEGFPFVNVALYQNGNLRFGGTTDFDSYRIKVKPEQGKTLIWPAEWPHAHYGSILKSGEKFIITGWIDFKV